MNGSESRTRAVAGGMINVTPQTEHRDAGRNRVFAAPRCARWRCLRRRGRASRRRTWRACRATWRASSRSCATQRQLILQLMQVEQQRYDVVLKYLQAGGAPGGGRVAGAAAAAGSSVHATARRHHRRSGHGGRRRIGAPGGHRHGAGADGRPAELGEAYVYVDGLRAERRTATPSRSSSGEAVRPARGRGAGGDPAGVPQPGHGHSQRLLDGPGNAFDLGAVKGGEKSRPVCCSSPGTWRSSATSTRRCAPTSWWCPTATGRAWGADGSFRCRGPGRDAARWSCGARAQADVAAGRCDGRGGTGRLHGGGDRHPAAHEQARAGVRFLR